MALIIATILSAYYVTGIVLSALCNPLILTGKYCHYPQRGGCRGSETLSLLMPSYTIGRWQGWSLTQVCLGPKSWWSGWGLLDNPQPRCCLLPQGVPLHCKGWCGLPPPSLRKPLLPDDLDARHLRQPFGQKPGPMSGDLILLQASQWTAEEGERERLA